MSFNVTIETFTIEEYFEWQYIAYLKHGVLLSQAERLLFEESHLIVEGDKLKFLQLSIEAIDRELALNLQTLADAEKARDSAQENEAKLAILNEELAKKQLITEAQLVQEREFRLKSQQTGFQKQFSLVLVALITFSLLLPYLGAIFSVSEKVSDATNNLSLLLVQTLAAVSAFLFSRQKRDGESE